jgi:hypothetical protein
MSCFERCASPAVPTTAAFHVVENGDGVRERMRARGKRCWVHRGCDRFKWVLELLLTKATTTTAGGGGESGGGGSSGGSAITSAFLCVVGVGKDDNHRRQGVAVRGCPSNRRCPVGLCAVVADGLHDGVQNARGKKCVSMRLLVKDGGCERSSWRVASK